MARTKTTKSASEGKRKAPSKASKKAASPKRGIPRAAPEVAFVLVDGRRLYDYKELADMLDELEDHVYEHHVNAERNDFAAWIHDVFQEPALAQALRESKGKHHAQIVIYRHILENA